MEQSGVLETNHKIDFLRQCFTVSERPKAPFQKRGRNSYSAELLPYSKTRVPFNVTGEDKDKLERNKRKGSNLGRQAREANSCVTELCPVNKLENR